MNPSCWCIIPAAGIGKRFSASLPKQYADLHGKPVIVQAMSHFLTHPLINKIVVALAPNDIWWSKIEPAIPSEKVITITGGKERADSVYQGLLALESMAKPNDWVLVHDAARPYLERQHLDQLMTALQNHPIGGLLGVPVRDTLKAVNEGGHVIKTIDRKMLWQAQTPQMFRYNVLRKALEFAKKHNQLVTDEASAVELLGEKPLMVEGSASNVKITYPEDFHENPPNPRRSYS